MAVNITPLLEVNSSNVIENTLGVLLINSAANAFFLLLFWLALFLIIKHLIDQNYSIINACFGALSLTLAPLILLRLLVFLGVSVIPDWWIATHLALWIITAIMSYLNKR